MRRRSRIKWRERDRQQEDRQTQVPSCRCLMTPLQPRSLGYFASNRRITMDNGTGNTELEENHETSHGIAGNRSEIGTQHFQNKERKRSWLLPNVEIQTDRQTGRRYKRHRGMTRSTAYRASWETRNSAGQEIIRLLWKPMFNRRASFPSVMDSRTTDWDPVWQACWLTDSSAPSWRTGLAVCTPNVTASRHKPR
jgi:hypothetical protein